MSKRTDNLRAVIEATAELLRQNDTMRQALETIVEESDDPVIRGIARGALIVAPQDSDDDAS